MCCRVKFFLCGVSLAAFGVFFGWLNLITSFLAELLLIPTSIYAFYNGMYFFATFLVFVCLIMFVAIAFSKEFIVGIEKRNHKQMIAFRNFFMVGLSFRIIMYAALFVNNLLRLSYPVLKQQNAVVNAGHAVAMSRLSAILICTMLLAIEIYLFICISSLFHDVKDENLGKRLTRKAIVQQLQQQPHQHRIEHQVVIAMQPINPEQMDCKADAASEIPEIVKE